MKFCPKCEGRYFDDMEFCSECYGGNKIELVTEMEFKTKTGKGFATLKQLEQEERETANEYLKEHPEKNIKPRRIAKPNIKQINSNEFIPKCPTCSSTNIEKISGADKMLGAVVFGLFSKTAHSQFKCKNCGYKW